jgi:hypothetical protein
MAIKEWFLMVQRAIDKNGIQPKDIYNFDRTGFAIGLILSQTVVTRAEYYGCFVSDLARTGYNHIDKLDFLADYPRARAEAFQPNIVQSSFAATSIVLVNTDRVLSKLNISLRTPSPPSS